MVNENISTKQPDSRAVYENTPYADEGDEVTYVHFTVVWLCELIIVCMSSARHLYILMSILKSWWWIPAYYFVIESFTTCEVASSASIYMNIIDLGYVVR